MLIKFYTERDSSKEIWYQSFKEKNNSSHSSLQHEISFFWLLLTFDSLFTNISLEENIEIYANTLFKNTDRVEGLSKIEFKELSSFGTKFLIFLTECSTSKSMESLWVHL